MRSTCVRPTVKGSGLTCEHLCIGILVLEGAVSEAASANWDGLIEAAIVELAADADAILRVVVLPDELREPERALTLLKFHGCAVLATRDPDKYRKAIVATRPQITAWNTSHSTKPIRDRMVSLATTKPTLMIGLSSAGREHSASLRGIGSRNEMVVACGPSGARLRRRPARQVVGAQ